jgi:hypothetical protein
MGTVPAGTMPGQGLRGGMTGRRRAATCAVSRRVVKPAARDSSTPAAGGFGRSRHAFTWPRISGRYRAFGGGFVVNGSSRSSPLPITP